ncbi:MAG: hypothetical protein JWL66_1790 [Sphingomonadales bacterium]|nr:hypothetical protein [Sphingomonadales bacterium]
MRRTCRMFKGRYLGCEFYVARTPPRHPELVSGFMPSSEPILQADRWTLNKFRVTASVWERAVLAFTGSGPEASALENGESIFE